MILKKGFYFVRHGQTDHNKGILTDDHEDISLNETGIEQARNIEPIIAGLPVQSVCFSPLKRAIETKEIITKRLSATHFEIPNLTECNGDVWSMMTEIGEQAFISEEKAIQIFMQKTLQGINEALAMPGPVLIVAHGGIHWAMCCLMGINDDWFIDNCVPLQYSIADDGKWTAVPLS